MNEQQTTDTTNVQITEQTADTSTNQTAATEQTGGAGQEQQTGNEQQQQEQTQTPNIPASGGEYELAIDGFDVDAFKAENGAVLERFHAANLSNEQASEVIKIWDEFQQTNIEALQQEWGDDYAVNVNHAKQAAEALGFKPEDLDSPTAIIKMAAEVSKRFLQEDLPPLNTQQIGAVDIQSLLSSEAYMNESHPDHARVYAQVVAHFEKQNR